METTALESYDQIAAWWDLPAEQGRSWLPWAARLHEIAMTVSYEGHHEHGRGTAPTGSGSASAT